MKKQNSTPLLGLGNHLCSEVESGILPASQNSPQKLPKGLYAEQLSGSAFTAPRAENKKSWLYRAQPSANHGAFKRAKLSNLGLLETTGFHTTPNRLRWSAPPFPKSEVTFLEGLYPIAVAGSWERQEGCSVSFYTATASMEAEAISFADSEVVILPQEGSLKIITEFGSLLADPTELVVIPRGIRFKVELCEKKARGYVCENFGSHLRLPELGPIGANGLANPAHFEAPQAAVSEREKTRWIQKYSGEYFETTLDHSPFDVWGWSGNYYPYKYDLKKFNTINTVSFDHPDPSIFTVLTSPSSQTGTANVDFVIFPERWMVAEHTFRPPYFHRNVMSEFMGLIQGKYDAKAGGFEPGGMSIHNRMSAHGPDTESTLAAEECRLAPQRQSDTLAFMFETRWTFQVTEWAMESALLQKNYDHCWSGLKDRTAK